MAPKKPSRLVDNPPSASPSLDHEQESEEEEEVDESQEEESEEEEQQQQKTPKKSHIKSEKNPQKAKPSSPSSSEEEHQEEEEEDGSDGDDDSVGNTKSSPTASDFTIKPSVPTHANTSKNQQHQQAKPTTKRVLELQKNDEKKDSSRKKSKLGQENGEETKKVVANSGGGGGSNFGRLWSEDDEISVLKGMIDYQNQKGSDPHADMGAFHEFVKGRFGFDVTKTQLYEKVRRLKKKFFNNLEKVGEDGQDPVFSKPHEFNSFELSKKVWGANNANGGGVSNAVDENVKASDVKAKKSGKVKSFEGKTKEDDKRKREDDKRKEDEKKREEEKKEDNEKMIVEKEAVKNVVKGKEGDFSEKYPFLSASFNVEILPMSESERKFLKGNISLIDSEKARELEENWKRLRIEEIEFFYRRSKLMIEQTRLVMDAAKKR